MKNDKKIIEEELTEEDIIMIYIDMLDQEELI